MCHLIRDRNSLRIHHEKYHGRWYFFLGLPPAQPGGYVAVNKYHPDLHSIHSPTIYATVLLGAGRDKDSINGPISFVRNASISST